MSKVVRTVATVVGVAAIAFATAGAGLALAGGVGLGAAGTLGSALAVGTVGVSLSGLATIAAGLSLVSQLTAKKPNISSGAQLEWTSDPNAGVPYAMGRTMVGGNIIYRRAYGGENSTQSIVTILSGGGPIQGYENLYVDDAVQGFDGSGEATGQLDGMYWRRFQLGATPSTALTSPAGAMPGWSTSSRLSGYAADVVTMRYTPKGKRTLTREPKASRVILGVKVYDPRQDSTYPGGSGACRALVESTYVYSENPWLHALTWCLGRWQNGKRVIGLGAPISAIDVPAFVEAANVADANGWKIGGAVRSRPDTMWSALKAMCQAGGGYPIALGAKISCVVNTPRVSIGTIKAADLAGPASVQATQSRRDRINSVVPRYRSEAHNWNVIPATMVRVASHVTEDGEERTREIEYPLVQQLKQVAELARYDIENAREFGPIDLPCKLVKYGYKPGDVVTVTVPEIGLNGRTVLLLDRTLDPANNVVQLTARSETTAKHAFALGQTTTAPPTPGVSGPPLIPNPGPTAWAISATTISTGGDALPTLVITGATDADGADGVLFEYRPYTGLDGDDDNWIAAGGVEPATVTRKEISSVTGGTQYQVSVRYRFRGEFSQTRLILGPATTGARPGASNYATVWIYQRSATAPAKPSATATYTFGTGTITGLNNGWTAEIPAGTAPLWVCIASAVSSGGTDTIAGSEWTDPKVLARDGEASSAGMNTATVFLYQRNNTGTPPAVPTAALTYTFASAALSGGSLAGWSQTVPAESGGRYLFITTATAASVDATDSIPTGEWAAVRKLSQDGLDGVDGAPGAPGLDGAPGAPGANGQTFWTWIAYADAADGSVNFTTGAPGDRKFIGLAANKTTAVEGTNPADYTWSQYAGPPQFGLVNQANMNIAGNKVTKVSGGGSSWNGSVYSSEAWVGGAFVSFRTGQANAYVAVGLNTDPTSDADYASIDYCWDAASNGTAHIYENGVAGGSFGAYTPDTIFSIHYDGANVRYYMDGDLKRTVTAASGLKLYLDSSFYTLGGSATITGFGPAGAAGADGLSIAELTIYRRATSAPATPAGGSYNFGTKVLTPPSGWSTSIPAGNDPLYAASGSASVQGVTGTATPAWLGVGLLAQEGAATNLVFRRSAAAPATPAPSSGVPASWYDSTASVPAGPDPIWASFGTRPNAGANWTWQAPKVIEGSNGTDGLTFQLSPLAIVIAANSDGSIKDGELPLAFRLKTTRGATNLSPSSPVSVAFSTGLTGTINNTASSSDRGLGSLTGMTATSGYIDVTVTVDGVAQQPQRISVQRKDDPPPPASAVSLSTVALGNNTADTYAASPNGAILTLQADASGQLRAILTASYNAAGGAVPRTWQYAAKAVYRAAGSAGAWSDFGAEVTGLLAFRNTSENNPGALSFSQLRTGLTANANYEVGVMWRRVTGNATNPIPTGTLTVRQP